MWTMKLEVEAEKALAKVVMGGLFFLFFVSFCLVMNQTLKQYNSFLRQKNVSAWTVIFHHHHRHHLNLCTSDFVC